MEAREVQEDSPAILQAQQTEQTAPRLPTLSLQRTPDVPVKDAEGAQPPSAPPHFDLELDSDAWELLSRSQCGSHCGSSPRALNREEAEEAAVEHDEEEEAQRRGRQATLLLLPPALPPPTLPPRDAKAAPAVAPSADAAALAASDTPRSAVSSGTVMADDRHDVYSLSQEGSVDNLSETYTDDLMTQAEPDLPPSPAAAARPPTALASPLPGGYAATMRSLRDSIGQELAALAERVRTYVASAKPSVTAAAVLVWRSVAQWVGSLQASMSVLGAEIPQRLAGLRAALPARLPALPAPEALQPHLAAGVEGAKIAAGNVKQAAASLGQRTLRVLLAARKHLAHAKWDWAHLALAASCLSMAALLARSWQVNARLAARLAEKEELLADLLIRIVKLRTNMTNRAVPILRHTSTSACSVAAQAAGTCVAPYPAYPLAITAV